MTNTQGCIRGAIVDRFCLNQLQSSRETWHIVIDLLGDRLPFRPGDSVGIWPKNSSLSVRELLEYFHRTAESPITDPVTGVSLPLVTWLTEVVDLNRVSSKLINLLIQTASSQDDRHLLATALSSGETFASFDVLSLLKTFVSHGVDLSHIVSGFFPILPRLYSISSGPSARDRQIELTVARVVHRYQDVCRPGLCSHYLIDEAPLHVPALTLFHQSTKHFIFPAADQTPLIMVGSGTGIAPFRAFMQEVELGAVPPPSCWLFFGEKRSSTDFFYEEFWGAHVAAGHLRMDLAFSQDQEHKIYVQHRMWEKRQELWKWMNNGATIMVCGNAKSMAKDVDACLAKIASSEGGLHEDESLRFLRSLRHQGRYLRDVY